MAPACSCPVAQMATSLLPLIPAVSFMDLQVASHRGTVDISPDWRNLSASLFDLFYPSLIDVHCGCPVVVALIAANLTGIQPPAPVSCILIDVSTDMAALGGMPGICVYHSASRKPRLILEFPFQVMIGPGYTDAPVPPSDPRSRAFHAGEVFQDEGCPRLRVGDECLCQHMVHVVDVAGFSLSDSPEPSSGRWRALMQGLSEVLERWQLPCIICCEDISSSNNAFYKIFRQGVLSPIIRRIRRSWIELAVFHKTFLPVFQFLYEYASEFRYPFLVGF